MASFHEHLVINRWLLSLFNQKNLQVFKARLGDDEFEGLDENGQTKFFEQLNNSLFHTDLLPQTDLRRYDLNIVRHWQTITERRNQAAGHRLEMKYFQYLSLLFTEIYLDWYFNRKAELQTALNASLQQYAKEPFAKDLQNYRLDDLNKIAFWNATGSGKTYLANAFGMTASRNFYTVRYVRLPDLLGELAIARAEGTYRKVMKQYRQVKLLILDEWLLYPLKEPEARDLLEIAEGRCKKASTIFCSQFEVGGWHQKIGEPTLADAICDRIVHDSYTIVIGGADSMRKRKGISEEA